MLSGMYQDLNWRKNGESLSFVDLVSNPMECNVYSCKKGWFDVSVISLLI